MESTDLGWWRRHGWTVVLLLTAFGISFLLRTVFMQPILAQFGSLNVYGGGSDSFYHSRVMSYIIQNHHNLVVDPMLRYPVGAINPREPLFDWMNAVLGIVFAPFFGGNAVVAGAFFLDLQGPLWSALGVFPVYLIGREVGSRRTGLVAALIFPFIVANIESSTFGYANYLAFYTFFILVLVYSYLRTVKAAGSRRWVEHYRDPQSVLQGLRGFLRGERPAVKWAVFTGVCFGTLAMAWQGYSYGVAVIAIFIIFALIVERVRHVDSFGLYVATWIVGLVGFPLAMPYYLAQGQFSGWFDLPLLVFFGALLVLLPFLFLRDLPWVVSVPVLIAVAAAGVLGLYVLDHSAFVNIVTGQGYFVKTLVYSTVAEAQAPSIDQLILGYGVVTFFLAFVGFALVLYEMVRGRFKRWLMLFAVFSVVSIYLPISAAKFFLIGSPAFALLPAEAIRRALDVGGYPELRRTVVSLSDRRSQFSAFRRAFKVRHVLVFLLVVGVLLPNFWYAVDAGIPYNSKSSYETQIYNTLPPSLRPSGNPSTLVLLGAAGSSLDTPAQYDEAGYNWLAQQDSNVPPPQRPAFISWWDYGFQAVAQGTHPTVADNFQNGIEPAGNFLLSQNESLAIGILATDLLAAEQRQTGLLYLPAGLNQVLAADGLNVAELHTLLVNQTQDVALVNAHPERYLPVDPSHLSPLNAVYDTVSYFLATSLPLASVAQVYDDIQSYTGWSIRYAMVDNRLFPFSGQSTGIFYAPADLTDRIISSGGVPVSYFNVTVLGSNGVTYPLGQSPAGVQAVNYNINYHAPFYNSMIYRIFIGYNGTDIGLSGGIPGLSGAAGTSPIEPGWMLQHFQIVYRTAYFCPRANQTPGSSCFAADNLPTVVQESKSHGTADTSPGSYFGGGETMLEYYPGEVMTGTVTLPDGTPVSNARLTVFDSWGIPHQTTSTGSDGSYSIVLPPGSDTVNVTSGALNGLLQQGAAVLKTLHLSVSSALGYSNHAPPLLQPIVLRPVSVSGTVYWNTANNSSYVPSDPLIVGGVVKFFGTNLPTYTVTTDASGTFTLPSVTPGVYSTTVTYLATTFKASQLFATSTAPVKQSIGLTPASVRGTVFLPNHQPAPDATVSLSATNVALLSATSNVTGGYLITPLPPGNFSVYAQLAGGAFQSATRSVVVSSVGSRVTQNLSLVAAAPVSFLVVANGNPLPDFPVRVSVIPSWTNASLSLTSLYATSLDSPSVLTTNSQGVVSGRLPAGNYSLYAVGYVGAALYAGFESAYLTPVGTLEPSPLFLAPAAPVGGVVNPTGSASGSESVVTAFDSRGDQVSTLVNANHSFSIYLPASSTFTLWTLSGPTPSSQPQYSALMSVNTTTPQTVSISPSPAVLVRLLVGAAVAQLPLGIFSAARGQVTISDGTGGPAVTALTDNGGNVSLLVPTALPFGGDYCLSIQAFGFQPFSECNLTPSGLTSLSKVTVALVESQVTFVIHGLPVPGSFRLNLTALTPTAQSVSQTGGPTFAFSAFPGTYAISGYAAGSGSGLYLPPQAINLTIPLGARETNASLTLFFQVPSKGSLTLPSGISNRSVEVRLGSATVNVSVNGTAFETRFFIAPGTYSAFATTFGTTPVYSSVASITVNATGVLSAPIVLTTAGTHVTGNLTVPGGGRLNTTTTATFATAGGLATPVTVSFGVINTTLPAGLTYSVVVNVTVPVVTGGITTYTTYTTSPGTTCSVAGIHTACNVGLLAMTNLVWVNGTLNYPGHPSPVPGSATFVGPSPSLGVTGVSTASGAFSLRLAPGVYSVYATGGGSSNALANLSQLTVSGTTTAASIDLSASWVDTVTVTPPASVSTVSTTVIISGDPGTLVAFPNVPFSTALAVALPRGTYSVSASTTGNPYGLPARATATETANLLSGNAATNLALAYVFTLRAQVTVAPPTSVTIAEGTSVSFAFSIQNMGNAPISVHPAGTPSSWSFAFTIGNVTLGVLPGNNTIAGEVVITPPKGTPVNHPPLTLQALFSNGTVAGAASPAPAVVLLPSIGLSLGPASSIVPSIGPFEAEVSFYVANTGNIEETVPLAVTDASRLINDGWTVAIIAPGGGAFTAPVVLNAGANQTYTVKLVAASGYGVDPGTITVTGSTTNGTNSVSLSTTLTVPLTSVNPTTAPIIVTGPNVGSAPTYPDWLVPFLAFVPAIGLVVGVLTYRWWRTRRWSRR